MTMTRGIKKVSEQILTEGRGIIVTEKDKLKYDWNDIPPGSKFIDITTGIEQVKLEDILIDKMTGVPLDYDAIVRNNLVYKKDGQPYRKKDGTQYTSSDVEYSPQSDWVPSGIRQDGTLCIARDGMILEEVFTVQQLNDGAGNMVYKNTIGEIRRFPIAQNGAYVFELEYGQYIKGRNHIEAYLDDQKRIDFKTGGLIEIKENRIGITEPLSIGEKVTVRYLRIFRLGSPYPRIFIDDDQPESAEVGDLWLDTDDYINTNLGVTIDKYILSDEPLDGGFQRTEPHGAPNDAQ